VKLLLLLLQLEVGLLNTGPLATEVTHRVRALSMPGSLTIGGGYQYKGFRFSSSLTFTTLTVTRCVVRCNETDRDYRPHRTEPIEQEADAVILTPRVGYSFKGMEAGLSFPTLQTAYTLVGPSPMMVVAPYASASVGARGVSVFVRYAVVPPQPARFVAFSEWSGFKTPGVGRSDPLWLRFVEAGIRVQ
jgi:hypothetical protein